MPYATISDLDLEEERRRQLALMRRQPAVAGATVAGAQPAVDLGPVELPLRDYTDMPVTRAPAVPASTLSVRGVPDSMPAPDGIVPTASPDYTPNPNDPSHSQVYTGERTVGLSSLGKAMARKRALESAGTRSTVKETAEGIEIAPPEQSPSRLRQALLGLAQGIALTNGNPNANLGTQIGAGITGALTGAISPDTMLKYSREQEQAVADAKLAQQQDLALNQAKIGIAQSQPELESLRVYRQLEEDARREADRQADNARQDRSVSIAEENAKRDKTYKDETLADRKRRTDAMVNKPKSKITVNGRTFELDTDEVTKIEARREAAREANGGKPDPHTEATVEADIEANNEVMYRKQKNAAVESAKALRLELDKLDPTEDANKVRIRTLERQIADAERDANTAERNETAAITRKGNAVAKAAATPAKNASAAAPSGKLFDLRAWLADHPNATEEEIAAKRRKYAGRIRE